MRSIVFNPSHFAGAPKQRIEAIHAYVREAYCDDVANVELGKFTTRAFAAIMYRGFIPDLVYGHSYRVVRRRLLDTFTLNGGKISVRRLMGGAIRIKILRPLRDLEKEASEGKRTRSRARHRKPGGNQEAPRKADDAGAA